MFPSRQKWVVWLQRTGKVLWKAPLRLQQVVMVVFGLWLSGLIVASVVFRYFLKIPLLWVEELSLYFVFWFYLLGAAYATHKRSHIKGGGLLAAFKKKPRLLGCFQSGIISISLGLSCLASVWSYTMFSWTLRVGPTTPFLHLPQAYAQLALLAAFPLISMYFLVELIDSVRGTVRAWHIANPETASGNKW